MSDSSLWGECAARSKGVSDEEDLVLGFAPAANKSRTISMFGLTQAKCKGVIPPSPAKSTEDAGVRSTCGGNARKSSRAISTCPDWIAAIKGVTPSWQDRGRAPTWINIFKI